MSRFLISLAPALLFSILESASAQTSVTLHVDSYVPISSNPAFFNADMVRTSGIVNFGTSTPYTYTQGSMFCLSPGLSSYSPGTNANFNIISAGDALQNLSLTVPQENQAAGYVNWLVDNYYDSYISNPGAISNTLRQDRAQAFENVLREIMVDWNGTNGSLGGNSGGYIFSLLTMTDYSVADSLLASVISSGAPSSYTASNYKVDYYQSKDFPASPGAGIAGQAQNMLMIAPIPEPSGCLALGLLGSSVILRRGRNLKKSTL